MTIFRLLSVIVGILILAGMLLSALKTFVLPRAANPWLTRTSFRIMGKLFRLYAESTPCPQLPSKGWDFGNVCPYLPDGIGHRLVWVGINRIRANLLGRRSYAMARSIQIEWLLPFYTWLCCATRPHFIVRVGF